jgi:hypothetical protein
MGLYALIWFKRFCVALTLLIGISASANVLIITSQPASVTMTPTNIILPTITGTAQVGQTLTAHSLLTDWANNPTSLAYQWGEPANVFNSSLPTAGGTFNGCQVRVIIPPANLTNPGMINGTIKVAFSVGTGTAAGSLTGAYVGELGPGGGVSFDSNQVRLTFSGANTVTGLNGPSIFVSDRMNFALDPTKSLMVSAVWGGTQVNSNVDRASTNNSTWNSCTDLDASVTMPPTYPGSWSQQTNTDHFVSSIDFAPASIPGAAASTYVPVAEDVGEFITVSVTASNIAGASAPAISASTVAIIDLPPTINTAASIPGTPQVGVPITAVDATWNHTVTSTAYQWTSGINAIPGATSLTYTPVTADIGNKLTITVTATNSGGTSAPSTSGQSATVIGPSGNPPVNINPPTISGLSPPQVNSTLTAHTLASDWTNGPTGFAYQWNSSPAVSLTTASLSAHNTSANPAYNQTNFNTPNPAGLNVANFTPATTNIGPGPTTMATDPTKQDRSLNPVTPGHVSHVNVHSLIPSPTHATDIWLMHSMTWWGTSNEPIHMGINMNTTAYVQAWVTDLISRGFNGIELSWNFSDPNAESILGKIKAYVDTLPAGTFYYVVNIDEGTITNAPDKVATLEAAIAHLKSTYFSDPAWLHVNGNPAVLMYGVRNSMNSVAGGGQAAMNTVKANQGGNMFWSDVDTNCTYINEAWEDAPYDWHDAWFGGVNGGDPYNLGAIGTFLSCVGAHPAKAGIGAMAGGYNETLARPNGAYLQQDSGKTIVQRAAYINTNIPSNIHIMHWATWNDYPEGTGSEPAYENDISVTASAAGTTLNWTPNLLTGTASETTVDHYEIYASPDGANSAFIGNVASGTHTFNLAPHGFTPGVSYTAVVYAVGKPNIRNHVSNAVTFVGPTGTYGPSNTYAPITADIGNTLTVSVVASNSAGASAPASSVKTSAVVGSSGACPFAGAGYPDGCGAAPSAAIQFPTLLSAAGYAVRPPWDVAGVDYAVGVPSNITPVSAATATVPTGCSRNAGTFQWTCTNATVDSIDFSPNGGWQLICNGGTLTVTNSNFGRGTNAQDMLVGTSSCTNLTGSYNKFDAHSITGGSDGNVFCNANTTSSSCTFTYNWFLNASLDFIDIGSLTAVVKYNLFTGPGGGTHSDWFQTGGGPGAVSHITWDFNTVNQTSGTGSQGVTFGTNINGNIGTSEARFNTTIGQTGANISYHYAVDPTQTTGAVQVSNNYADIRAGAFGSPRFALPGSSCLTCSGGGSSTFSNNINLVDGTMFSNNP